MEILVAIVVIVVLVAIAVRVVSSRRKAATAEQRAARDARIAAAEAPGASVRALKPGDVVGMGGAMWIVEGTLRFDEDGFEWQEHLLVDGERRRWLSVEDDEGRIETILWERLRAPGLDPSGDRVTHEDTTFTLDERGRARFTSQGATGAPAGGQVEYADFRAGEERLGFERYSAAGTWEVSRGRPVPEHSLDVYGGGGAPAAAG